MQVRTMDPHLSSKSTGALVPVSKISGTILNSEEVVSSTRNKNVNVVQKVTVKMLSRPAVGVMMDRSTLPCLPSFLQGLIEAHDGLDFCAFYTPSCYSISQDRTLVYPKNYVIHVERLLI